MITENYNLGDWYWAVADASPSTQRYSTAARAYVPVSAPGYLAWLSDGNTDVVVPTQADLQQYLARINPALLPPNAPEPADALVPESTFRARIRQRVAGIDKPTAFPLVAPAVGGGFLPVALTTGALSTIAAAANRFDAAPFAFSAPLTIDAVGLEVTTLAAGGLFTISLYDDTAGAPGARLAASAEQSAATTGLKTFVFGGTFTFKTFKRYWIAVHSNSTAVYRGVPIASMLQIGALFGVGSTPQNIVRGTSAYSATPPANAPATARASAIFPAVLFRAA